MHASEYTFGVAISNAGGVMDDVRPAAVLSDHHHDVPRNVDQIPHLQLAQDCKPFFVIVVGSEFDAIQRGADGLIARVTRQLHAEAAIDLGYKAAAVARVVGAAPAVALPQEFETL